MAETDQTVIAEEADPAASLGLVDVDGLRLQYFTTVFDIGCGTARLICAVEEALDGRPFEFHNGAYPHCSGDNQLHDRRPCCWVYI
jgi:hypothetical protein